MANTVPKAVQYFPNVDPSRIGFPKALRSCAGLGWSGIAAVDYAAGSGEIAGKATAHRISLMLEGDVQRWWRRDGIARYRKIAPGDLDISPFGDLEPVSWKGASRFFVVGLRPDFVRAALADTSRADLPYFTPSPLSSNEPASLAIRRIMLRMSRLLNEGPGNALEAEALGISLGRYIAQIIGDVSLSSADRADGLSRPALRRVIDCVDANLAEPITLQQLAVVAGVSPFHFCRAFRKSTGVSPWQYVLRWRIDRAVQAMRTSPDEPLASIAGRLGFADQSHLNRVCKKVRGFTPGELLRQLRRDQ